VYACTVLQGAICPFAAAYNLRILKVFRHSFKYDTPLYVILCICVYFQIWHTIVVYACITGRNGSLCCSLQFYVFHKNFVRILQEFRYNSRYHTQLYVFLCICAYFQLWHTHNFMHSCVFVYIFNITHNFCECEYYRAQGVPLL